MRVLVLSTDPGIPLLGPSGASAHLRGIARALRDRGDDVRIAVPSLGDAVDDHPGVPVVTSPPRRWAWLPRSIRERGQSWDARRLYAAATADFEPELVWERYAVFGDAVRAKKCRWILEVNAPAAERIRYGRVYSPELADEIERDVLRSADDVVAVSAWLTAWAIERGARARHVPNGVQPIAGDRASTRRRLGLDGLVIGFLGTMKPWHGIDRLPAILDAVPEATALVVGDGPVAIPKHPRLNAQGRVPPAAVPHLVAAMDVGLAPYAGDAPPWFCPLKVLEYRAQGVPVVGTDTGDVAARIGADGVVVRDGDWATAIRQAAALPRIPAIRSWDDVVAQGTRQS